MTVEKALELTIRSVSKFEILQEQHNFDYWKVILQSLRESVERKKYGWHDLRLNPNDLPQLYQDVIVVNDDKIQHIGLLRSVNWGNEANPCMVAEWCIKYSCYDTDVWEEQENGKIIAWREKEPFEG